MMNLKGFKKVSEDKQSATLQHPKGHKITVMVSKLTPIEKEALKRLDMCKPEREEGRKEYAEGSKDEPVSQGDSAPVEGNVSPAPVTINVEGAKQPATQVTTPPVAGAKGVGDTSNLPGGAVGVEQEETGLQQKEKVEAEQAKLNAASQQAYADQRSQIFAKEQENAVNMTKHVDDFNEYTKTHPIRHDAYFEDMSAPKRVVNAIGLLLAGSGGAGAHAMDFLNKEVDRNIAAQVKDIENQNNVYHAYEALYHDQVIATNLAKASALDMLDNQMKLTAQRLGTAQAQANYNIASGALKVKRQQEIGMAAQRLTGIKSGAVQPEPGPAGQAAVLEKHKFQKRGHSILDRDKAHADVTGESEKEDEPEKVNILHDDAEDKYKRLFNTPKAKEQMPEITKQYNQAIQSQKALDAIAKKFPQLREEATLSGNINENINPHAAAAVLGAAGTAAGAVGGGLATGPLAGAGAYPGAVAGGAAGAAVGEGLAHSAKLGLKVTGGQQQVKYNADRTALTKIIAAALKGTNVSSEQIQDVLDSNIPSYWDKKETYNKKMKNIQEFIKQNTETGLLKTWKLSHE